MPQTDDSLTAVELVDPLVGTIFDKRFRVDERLAAGGFGAIYRATHIKSGHQIALKVLHSKLASDLGVLARFRREGTTLTSLRNPHTITAYEFGQSERTLFIVMELLHGETLYEHFENGGPLPWKRVVHIALQVCESLAEAHAQGIVHRDLKPTNIHLEQVNGDRDYVKVLDFGIAKILRGSEHDASDITNAGQMIGTLDYMSPEQMVGGQVTGQTDIYTLGIVMYEMIAGTRPFPESQTASAALAAMLKTTPASLGSRVPVPRELDALVMRCLERDTQKRYRTILEVRAALEQLDAGAASLQTETATVALSEESGRAAYDVDGDSTTIAPPSDNLLDSLRPSKSDIDTTVHGVDALPPVHKGWDDDAPTTAHRPEDFTMPPTPTPTPTPVMPASALPPAARPGVRPAGRPTPPVAQLVAAPFSSSSSPPSSSPPTSSSPAAGTSHRASTAPTVAAPVVPASTPARASTTSTPPRASLSPSSRPSTAPPVASSPVPRTGPHAPYPGGGPMSGTGPHAPHPGVGPMSGTGPHAPHPGVGPIHAGSPYPGSPYPGSPAMPHGAPGAGAPYGAPMPYGGPPPMPGYGLPPTPGPYAPHAGHGHGMPPHVPSASYDMSAMAARDAALRRFVWMLVLVLGAIVGVVIATQL